MNHLTENEILDFLDGVTQKEDVEKVKDHLAKCSQCSKLLNLHTRISKTISKELVLKTKPIFTYNVLNKLNLIHTPQKAPLFFKILIALFILCFVIVVFTMLSLVLSSPTKVNPTNINMDGLITQISFIAEKIVDFLKHQRTDIMLSLTIVIVTYFFLELFYSKLKIKRK